MKNGLYSIQIQMLDGVPGHDSGVTILRDGQLISGGPYFWSIGSYTAGDGTWKGHFVTNQHTPFDDPFVRHKARVRPLRVPEDERGRAVHARYSSSNCGRPTGAGAEPKRR